jgi:Cu(I)/Ag(I) efflux system membrane fusion protein
VGFDERRLARISAKARGSTRIEKLLVNYTGATVEAGTPLAEVYSPELHQASRELLLASARVGRTTPAGGADLVALAREKLILWGLTDAQVDALLASGKPAARVPILAPLGGVVVRKFVVEGQYVQEGDPLFEVADLSRVWVLARVHEHQIGRVAVGQSVEATVPAYPGEAFRGRVAFLEPAVDPRTRTVAVRYDLENPDGRLRPGMYTTVTLRTPVASMPAFRERYTRMRTERGSVQLTSGTPADQKVCPVTDAALGSMGAPVPVEVPSGRVWVCCAGCTDKLKAEPERYLAAFEAPPADAVLTVPESAVVDTGGRTIVYVEAEPGTYEGRAVVLGPRSGDRFPVLEGLRPGDRVAAAGAFLIDAETRLNPGAAGTYVGARGASDRDDGPATR